MSQTQNTHCAKHNADADEQGCHEPESNPSTSTSNWLKRLSLYIAKQHLENIKARFCVRFGVRACVNFETGHALYGYDGKCKNVHGHSYKLSVTVIGKPITDNSNVKFGMVIDFTDLKKIVKEEIVDQFDHATVFNKNTPHIELAKELQSRDHHVILVDYQPTSENMVIDFANRIKNRLPQGIELHSLKLQETETSFAEWYQSDN